MEVIIASVVGGVFTLGGGYKAYNYRIKELSLNDNKVEAKNIHKTLNKLIECTTQIKIYTKRNIGCYVRMKDTQISENKRKLYEKAIKANNIYLITYYHYLSVCSQLMEKLGCNPLYNQIVGNSIKGNNVKSVLQRIREIVIDLFELDLHEFHHSGKVLFEEQSVEGTNEKEINIIDFEDLEVTTDFCCNENRLEKSELKKKIQGTFDKVLEENREDDSMHNFLNNKKNNTEELCCKKHIRNILLMVKVYKKCKKLIEMYESKLTTFHLRAWQFIKRKIWAGKDSYQYIDKYIKNIEGIECKHGVTNDPTDDYGCIRL